MRAATFFHSNSHCVPRSKLVFNARPPPPTAAASKPLGVADGKKIKVKKLAYARGRESERERGRKRGRESTAFFQFESRV